MVYILEIIHVLQDYIETHLEDEITLPNVAMMAGYSTWHFERLFHTCTGFSFLEYLKKRRLAYVAQSLLREKTTVIDLSIRYQFGTVETLIRCFNRYYGVTPTHYQNINRRIIYQSNDTQEASVMNNQYFQDNLNFSREERLTCLPLIGKCLELAQKAKDHGLLSLEKMPVCEPEFFMRKAIELILKGFEPPTVRTILFQYIKADHYEGVALLQRILVMEGILAIQNGESRPVITEKLLSLLGEECAGEAAKFYPIPSAVENSVYPVEKPTLEWVEKLPTAVSQQDLLQEPFKKLSNRSFQRLWREMKDEAIITALWGINYKTRMYIFENIPSQRAWSIYDEVASMRKPTTGESIESQKEILDILAKLKSQGDIS
jgi:AraC-like DNA-binding protein